MGKKLSASNAYLRDPAVRKEGMWLAAKTSSAVEGIRAPFAARDSSNGQFVSIKAGRPVRSAAKSGGSRR